MTAPSLKRKTLHDYFQSQSPCQSAPKRTLYALKCPISTATTTTSPNLPVGLSIIPDFVTTAEQATLVSFLEAETWRTDLSRRTIHYGGTYCLMPPKAASVAERAAISKRTITAQSIPNSLRWVIDRMIATDLYPAGLPPRFCIV